MTTPADKLRALAIALTLKIADLMRPRKENTPKRLKEGKYRRIDAAQLTRCWVALNILADAWENNTIPQELCRVSTKAQVMEMVRTKLDTSGGYYEVCDTGEFADQSPTAVALRKFIERQKSPRQAHDEAQLAKLNAIAELENKVKFADIDGFFPTPQQLADELVYELDCQPGMKVLEPSAGKGDLADAIRRRHVDPVDITCIERYRSLIEILEAKGYSTIPGDFTEYQPQTAVFDRVLMNPPYENAQDMQHVMHAWNFLKPGGRLIALMSPAFTFHRTKQADAFRAFLEVSNGRTTDLGQPFNGQDAFRQTAVRIVKVVLDKPGVRDSTAITPPTTTTTPTVSSQRNSEAVNRILNVLDEIARLAGCG